VIGIDEGTLKAEDEDSPGALSAIGTFNPYGTAQAHLLLDIPHHGAYQQRRGSPASLASDDGHIATPYSGESSTFEIPIMGQVGSQIQSELRASRRQRDLRSPYFPSPEDCQNSYFDIISTSLGRSSVEPLNYLPIEATKRNAELLHMCECFFNFSRAKTC